MFTFFECRENVDDKWCKEHLYFVHEIDVLNVM